MLFWQLFLVFTRVAFFSWGGGPASLGLMQREVIAAGWMTADEFADVIALSNALPGPTAPQASAFVGYKLAGLPGAVAAVAGTVLPTTILLLIAVAYFYQVKQSNAIKAMLTAVRPVVVGLLAWTTYAVANPVFNADKLGWRVALTQGWDKLAIAVVTFILLTFTPVNPVFIIIGAAVLGLIAYR
jgi:chromate transporter